MLVALKIFITRKVGSFVRLTFVPFLRIWENLAFPVRLDLSDDLSPIFIVGAPRTGSTILYQALTNLYQVTYIDNFAAKWFRNLRFGVWLSKKMFGDAPHNNYRAQHGSTQAFGLHAPSECGAFWYRWLSRERHFVDHRELPRSALDMIRKEVLGVTCKYGRPFLFKNLNAGQRLRLIREAFPGARIIYIKRDPRYVVMSILRARESLGIKRGHWWSIKPRNYKELIELDEAEMCACQVSFIESQIEEDLDLFPKEQIFHVHFNDLTASYVDKLGKRLGLSERAGSPSPPTFKADPEFEVSNELAVTVDRLLEGMESPTKCVK